MNGKYNFGIKLNYAKSNEEIFFSSYISENSLIQILNMLKKDEVFLGEKSMKIEENAESFIDGIFEKIGIPNKLIKIQNAGNLTQDSILENQDVEETQNFIKKCELQEKSCIGFNPIKPIENSFETHKEEEDSFVLPEFFDYKKKNYHPIISTLN